MVAVALISAFITMRLAIHGREAVVPTLVGLSITDATRAAAGEGLSLALENRFYSSDVPAGRILAQDPAPGLRVRRDWPVRITESLGPQQVSIPDLTGDSERAATVSIRRLSLEVGTVAHLALPGDPDVVVAQSPPVNSTDIDGPRVSLLVSDPESSDQEGSAYVMPSLVGLSYAAAAERIGAAGLRVVATAEAPPQPPAAASSSSIAPSTPAAQPAAAATPSAPTATPAAPQALVTSGTVIAQTPQPGRRVVRGDLVQIVVRRSSAANAEPTPQ